MPYNKKSLPALFSAETITKAMCMVVTKLGDVQTAKKNSRKYRQITLMDYNDTTGEILGNGKEYSRIIWDELKDKEGKTTFKADSLFNNAKLKEGMVVAIGHVTFNTTPYVIKNEGRTNEVSKITVLAFSNEDPLAIANAQLNRKDEKDIPQGAYVLNLDGEPTPLPLWKLKDTEDQDDNMLVNREGAGGVTAEELAEMSAIASGAKVE